MQNVTTVPQGALLGHDGEAKPTPDGKLGIDIAIPSFGYKSSISICRAFGFVRKCKVTDGARFDGRMLRDVVTSDNNASDVWANTSDRSQANEAWLKRQSTGSTADTARTHREHSASRSRSKLMAFYQCDRWDSVNQTNQPPAKPAWFTFD